MYVSALWTLLHLMVAGISSLTRVRLIQCLVRLPKPANHTHTPQVPFIFPIWKKHGRNVFSGLTLIINLKPVFVWVCWSVPTLTLISRPRHPIGCAEFLTGVNNGTENDTGASVCHVYRLSYGSIAGNHLCSHWVHTSEYRCQGFSHAAHQHDECGWLILSGYACVDFRKVFQMYLSVPNLQCHAVAV